MTEHPTDAKFEPPQDNWVWEHYSHRPHTTVPKKPLPAPRTRPVTAEDPIAVDCFYSLRSPYSYLVLDRLLYLASPSRRTFTLTRTSMTTPGRRTQMTM